MNIKRFSLLSLLALAGMAAASEPLPLPDCLWAGQSKQRQIFIIRDGAVAWHYTDPDGKGEISDAVLLTDGHVLVAQQYSIREIDAAQRMVWEMDAPADCEIHTIQPVGKHHVLYVLNGKPAKAVVMEIPSLKTVLEFPLPYNEKGSVHGQFRNARLTSSGTLLVSNMSMGFVAEYNEKGEELKRWGGFSPWSATELPNRNVLIVGRKGEIREYAPDGTLVWEINTVDYGITQPQKAYRLPNGNTLISNWFNEWNKVPVDLSDPPVQAIEITPDKQVVYTVRSWENPNLGPATTLQPLTERVNRRKMHFGSF